MRHSKRLFGQTDGLDRFSIGEKLSLEPKRPSLAKLVLKIMRMWRIVLFFVALCNENCLNLGAKMSQNSRAWNCLKRRKMKN